MVESRANLRCEYCKSPSDLSSSPFSVEHVHPRSEGGSEEQDNLAWACMGCNDRKYTATHGLDPVSGQIAALFHPRKDRWTEHFTWAGNFTLIVGCSPTGRATIQKLNLNRPEVVKLRQILQMAGEPPPV
jgi:5-methylcytosine-specific restriction endonuclease McrA